jgi:hypothetical protein
MGSSSPSRRNRRKSSGLFSFLSLFSSFRRRRPHPLLKKKKTCFSFSFSSTGNPAPAYLDGSLPGDYGFDPLRLGSDPEILKWFTHAELIHSRVAMAAVAGILFPAVATKAGAASVPEWFESNKVFQDGATAYPFGEQKLP